MDEGRGKKDEKRANKIRTVRELTDSGQVAAETQTWVEFTFQFIKFFIYGIGLAAPLLISLALLIIILGQIVGARESWARFDSLYWAFITATTVGYGDIRPLAPLSKSLSVLIALTGIIFTGIIVALAINAATISFKSLHDIAEVKSSIEAIK